MAAAGYTCSRYFVYSSDRIGGTTSDYRIQINPAFHRVAYVDWASSSITGYLLQVPELRTHGRTSNNLFYWRFVNDLRNGRLMPRPDQQEQLYDLQTLSIRWLNPDGTLAVNLPEHVLELEIYAAA